MAFQGLTPESLLDRSDSKNPATTCKGLTTSGRPCRRGLGGTPGSSPSTTPTKGPRVSANDENSAESAGVMAIIDSTNAAAFFCWQHKDQAQNLIAKIENQQRQQQQQQQQYGDLQRRQTRIIPLQKRSSIDTLVERVGIIDLDGDVNDQRSDSWQAQPTAPQNGNSRPGNVKVRKRDTLPVEWQGIQGPLMSVPEEVVNEVAPEPRIQQRQSRSRSRNRFDQRESRPDRISTANARPRPKSSWSCCGLADGDYKDDGPPIRRRERYQERRPSRSSSRPRPSSSFAHPTSYNTGATTRPVPQASVRPQFQMQERPQYQTQDYNTRAIPNQTQQQQQQLFYPSQPQLTSTHQRPPPTSIPLPTALQNQSISLSTSTPPHTQTTHLLSLIPPHLDPPTTSALLTELSKPFAKDDDAGYIYIYWLTPSSSSTSTTNPNNNNHNDEEDKPDDDIASTILDSDSESDSDLVSKESYRPNHARRRSKSGQSRSLPHLHSQSTAIRRKAAINRYASIKSPNPNPSNTTPTPPKILLKIGRATNVHRRMTQWSKQCGQNITLVRYYPYQSSTSPSAGVPGGKVPHVNRVERLIHLELRGMGLGYGGGDGEKCGVCGRGHREWFEVEGTRGGLRGVDSVVRRWVGWGMGG